MRARMTGMDKSSSGSLPARADARSGFAAAIGAFAIWGLFPLYLKPLSGVPPLQIMAHRIVWCCLLVFAWLAVRGELGSVRAALANPASRRRLAASATLISCNWLIYVWAVNSGHVVDASLGYFINPLLNVVLGVFVLHERLNRAQWTAVGLAAVGVLYLAVVAGRPPWIALALAASFGMYGLIRKVVAVDSVPGLATETLLLTPFAAAFLVWAGQHGTGALGHSSAGVNALLVGSGLITAMPLALFAYGARLIPLSTVGLVQYIGPTLQFLLGVLVFHEPFPRARAVGFVMIWSALAIYAADGVWRRRRGAEKKRRE
jgi:chloramphenicol-sensitive protein RarD